MDGYRWMDRWMDAKDASETLGVQEMTGTTELSAGTKGRSCARGHTRVYLAPPSFQNAISHTTCLLVSVDSLCRVAPTRHANRMAQNSQARQLQAIFAPYTYSTSAFVPTKTLTVRKIHSYNHLYGNWPNRFFLFIIIFFT